MRHSDNVFSEAQVLTATAASTNYIDTYVAGDLTDGTFIQVWSPTILDSAAEGATIAIAVQTDTVSNFASPTTLSTVSIAEASLTAGIIAKIPMPIGLERYVRMYYTVTGEDFTTGSISAAVFTGIDNDNTV